MDEADLMMPGELSILTPLAQQVLSKEPMEADPPMFGGSCSSVLGYRL